MPTHLSRLPGTVIDDAFSDFAAGLTARPPVAQPVVGSSGIPGVTVGGSLLDQFAPSGPEAGATPFTAGMPLGAQGDAGFDQQPATAFTPRSLPEDEFAQISDVFSSQGVDPVQTLIARNWS